MMDLAHRHTDSCQRLDGEALSCLFDGTPLNSVALFALPLPAVDDHAHSERCVRWNAGAAVCAAAGLPLNFEGDVDPAFMEDGLVA